MSAANSPPGIPCCLPYRICCARPSKSLLRRLTALSLVPDLIVNAAADIKLTLILTHVVAAAIVVPVVAARLDASRRLGVERPQKPGYSGIVCRHPGLYTILLSMFPSVLLITRLIGGWRRWLSRSGAGGGLRCGRGWWGLPLFVRLLG
ncbi:DUF6069 family protein [Nocardia fluminea]|uniref:DUF6069 family protein n=1 Tax=Nocardia fluminea TaxID=134984 RepID=UPI00371782AC